MQGNDRTTMITTISFNLIVFIEKKEGSEEGTSLCTRWVFWWGQLIWSNEKSNKNHQPNPEKSK